MRRNDTATVGPGLYYAGRVLLYLILLTAPVTVLSWVTVLFPASGFLCGFIVMPLLYWSLYEMLRRFGVWSQGFLYLVMLMYLVHTVTGIFIAVVFGGWGRWLAALSMFVYECGFAWIAWRGYKASQDDARAAYNAEKEETNARNPVG